MREEQLAKQIKTFLQKVSLSSQNTQKVLAALDSEETQAKQEAQEEAKILRTQIADLDTKLEKLLDAFLADALSTAEYAAKKNALMRAKATLTEKITDIEQRGMSWLEPARAFVLSLNQAANLLSQNDLSRMTAFLKNIGSNHVVQNGQFVFDPKIQYRITAERNEAATSGLRFPIVWT